VINEDQVLQVVLEESVLIDKSIVGELYETGLKFLGIGIGGILYTAGKKGGTRGAQMLSQRLDLSGNDLLDAALLAFTHAHWGIGAVVRENGTTRIEVRNSVLALSVSRQKKPICHPLAGYIAGFFEQAWQKPVKVKETQCIAAGDACCVFQVE